MVISSSQNPEVKLYRSLLNKKNRDKTALIPLEGVRLIEEACRNQVKFNSVLYTEDLQKNSRGRELLKLIEEKQPQVKKLNVNSSLLRSIADTDSPQGIIATVEKTEFNLSQVLNVKNPFIVVVSGVQDPGNLGTIIRTASAAFVDGVIITRGTVDVYNPKTLRGTMGAIFHLPVVLTKDYKILIDFLRYRNIKMVITDPEGEVNCFHADLSVPSAVFFGGEAFGLSDVIKNAADYRINIPLPGPEESLNVAVSAGIVMYESLRQRHYSI